MVNIEGGVFSPILSFDQTTPGTTNALQELVINSNSQKGILGNNLKINTLLQFQLGKLDLNGKTLTLSGNIVNTVSEGLIGSNSSSLIVEGGSYNPELSFNQSSPSSSNLLNSLTINSASKKAILASNLEVNTLTFTNGKLSLNGNSLTLYDNVMNTVNQGIIGSNTSSLLLKFTSNSPTLSFDQETPGTTNSLAYFEINSSGQTIILDNHLNIITSTEFTDGHLITNPSALLIFNSVASHTSASDNSFVDGPVRFWWPSICFPSGENWNRNATN